MSKQSATPQLDFFHEYIVSLLTQNGYNLNDNLQKEFVPQFVAHAQVRVGAALMPLLKAGAVKNMEQLLEGTKTAAENWADFWKENVPNYEAVVKKTMQEFAKEVGGVVANVKSGR